MAVVQRLHCIISIENGTRKWRSLFARGRYSEVVVHSGLAVFKSAFTLTIYAWICHKVLFTLFVVSQLSSLKRKDNAMRKKNVTTHLYLHCGMEFTVIWLYPYHMRIKNIFTIFWLVP